MGNQNNETRGFLMYQGHTNQEVVLNDILVKRICGSNEVYIELLKYTNRNGIELISLSEYLIEILLYKIGFNKGVKP